MPFFISINYKFSWVMLAGLECIVLLLKWEKASLRARTKEREQRRSPLVSEGAQADSRPRNRQPPALTWISWQLLRLFVVKATATRSARVRQVCVTRPRPRRELRDGRRVGELRCGTPTLRRTTHRHYNSNSESRLFGIDIKLAVALVGGGESTSASAVLNISRH